MSTFMQYLLDSGIDQTPASWCCVFVIVAFVFAIVCAIMKIFFPRRK